MNNKTFWYLFFPMLLFLLTHCGKKTAEITQENKEYRNEIIAHRIAKDSSFIASENSPIPKTERKNFTGVHYFPVQLKYKIECKLIKNSIPDTFDIFTSKGIKRPAINYGYFVFILENQSNQLNVYKLLDVQDKYPNYLFLPFLDATSGKQSYGGGRYLDFHESTSDTYTLDFNLAYNPLCAYGRDIYRCPIPPAENALTIPIKAGEKKWH